MHCHSDFVANHFNQTNHSLDNFKVAICSKVRSSSRQIREIKEQQLIATFDEFDSDLMKIVLLRLIITDVLYLRSVLLPFSSFLLYFCHFYNASLVLNLPFPFFIKSLCSLFALNPFYAVSLTCSFECFFLQQD